MNVASPSHTRWLVVLMLAVIASRVPLVVTTYSSDPDAWRVANVGKIFWQTGNYVVSRFPGYPLHEIITGPLVVLGGSVLTNSSTLIASLALLLIWYGFVLRETSSPRLLTSLLAFTPLFWMNSAATLDYVWSLLFILCSLSAAQRRRIVVSGIWMGCAIGFRPTNAVAIAPLLVYLYYTHTSCKQSLMFVCATLCIAFAAFAPVWLTCGFDGWIQQTGIQAGRIHHSFLEQCLMFGYRSVYGMGPLAALAITLTLTLNWHRLLTMTREQNPMVVASFAGVLAFLILFAVFPLDRSYLLPAFPFIYILIDKVASRKVMVIVGCCIVSFAFINPDVTDHQRPAGHAGFGLRRGIVLEEVYKRRQLLRERTTIATLPITGKALVMTGTNESFWFENPCVERDTSGYWRNVEDNVVHSVLNPDLHFTSWLPVEAVRSLRAEGYELYNSEWMNGLVWSEYNYDPDQEGIKTIKP